MVFFWTAFGFLFGAIPFALLIGRWRLNADIRQYGDKNPGATNVLRAGGVPWFVAALLLDVSKGALPVGLAVHVFGLSGWAVVPIALAPPLGHALSPFLNWQGGKGIAATFGAWIGLVIWPLPLIQMCLLILFTLLFAPSGWAVLATLLATAGIMLGWWPEPAWLAVLAGHTLLLAWTHRADLRQRPRLRFGSPRKRRA